MQYNDHELVSLAKEGNEDAVNIIYQKYKPLIVSKSKDAILRANHHGIEIGHIEWAEVTMNADYSEVLELVLIYCDTDIVYEHTHIDENFDGVCDRAGCEVLTNNHTHVDNNYNDVCDYPGCTEAVKHTCIDDVNWDGKCDKCGKDTTVHSIVDVNKNGVCDYPGCKDKTPSTSTDNDSANVDDDAIMVS